MNLGNTYHAVIHPEFQPTNKRSSFIFEKYVLSSGTILMDLIQQKNLQKSVQDHLMKRKASIAGNSELMNLQNENFVVTHKINNDLVRRKARLKYLFNSKHIYKSIMEILAGFRARYIPFHQIEINQLLISSFVILEFCDANSIQSVKESLINAMSEKANSNESLEKLGTAVCVTTPFAHESFFETVNESKIANIFGDNNCLFIVSAPLVCGCEGGGVYNHNEELIGIVINTTFHWRKETAILSLVANFREIAIEFLQQINFKIPESPVRSVPAKCQMQRSVVLIKSGHSWGSGCLLKINNARMIITCSHIITAEPQSTVTCFWNKTKFSSQVIYKNPKHNHAYDIAILDAPDNIPDDCFAQHATDLCKIRDVVYSVGFPYFDTFSTKIDSPSIYEGRITKISKGMIICDVNVQSGQSGCPLFNKDNKLVGVCISNSKECVNETIYPNMSMAVPISDIITPLSSYSLLRDKRILNQLEARDDVLDIWQLKPPPIISKL